MCAHQFVAIVSAPIFVILLCALLPASASLHLLPLASSAHVWHVIAPIRLLAAARRISQ